MLAVVKSLCAWESANWKFLISTVCCNRRTWKHTMQLSSCTVPLSVILRIFGICCCMWWVRWGFRHVIQRRKRCEQNECTQHLQIKIDFKFMPPLGRRWLNPSWPDKSGNLHANHTELMNQLYSHQPSRFMLIQVGVDRFKAGKLKAQSINHLNITQHECMQAIHCQFQS